MDTRTPNLGSLKFLCMLYWPEAWRAEGRSSGSKPLIRMCYLLECFSRGRGVLYSFCTIIYSSPQSLTISVKSDSGDYSLAWNPLSLWLPRHPFLVLLLFFPLLSTLCASICPSYPLSQWYSSGIHPRPLSPTYLDASYISTASSTFMLSTPRSVIWGCCCPEACISIRGCPLEFPHASHTLWVNGFFRADKWLQ